MSALTAPADLNLPDDASDRIPCVLLLDTSYSIARDGRLAELNEALARWPDEVRAKGPLRRCAEFAIVTFGYGGVRMVSLDPDRPPPTSAADAFVPAARMRAPVLHADGVTPLAEGLDVALDLCEQRLELLAAARRNHYVPAIWIVTDGEPTDEYGDPSSAWRDALPRMRAMEHDGRLTVLAAGVDGADMEVLRQLAPNAALSLANVPFADLLSLVTMTSGAVDPYRQVRRLVDDLGLEEDR
jgi:uncharacterized protein YegL